MEGGSKDMAPQFVPCSENGGVSADEIRKAFQTLLRYVGENPQRDGLLQTPDRVARAWLEMTEGYQLNPAQFLSTTFEGESDEMVVLKNIEFTSFCEHHLLPFTGVAHVGYLPSQGRIVGLSKLARVVDVYAKRLQVQERMTSEIANAIDSYLSPAGVGVVVEGTHSCMCLRGVKKSGGSMITSHLRGTFRENPATRNEFLSLVRN
jgi:GTP cyclohydrolase I